MREKAFHIHIHCRGIKFLCFKFDLFYVVCIGVYAGNITCIWFLDHHCRLSLPSIQSSWFGNCSFPRVLKVSTTFSKFPNAHPNSSRCESKQQQLLDLPNTPHYDWTISTAGYWWTWFALLYFLHMAQMVSDAPTSVLFILTPIYFIRSFVVWVCRFCEHRSCRSSPLTSILFDG